MRGFSTGKLGEPLLNPSYLNRSREKAPGWGINGPGVSAEWTQGGESGFLSIALSLAICGLFYLVSSICMSMASHESEVLSPILAAWLPIMVFGSLGITLFDRLPS